MIHSMGVASLDLMKHHRPGSGCGLRDDGFLRPHGLEAMIYHAGLPSEERERVQKQFMESDKGIVAATIAFGMGIDKGV